jgi:hypothetical protein
MMAISDFAGDHFQSARIFGEHLYPTGSKRLWQGEVYRHDRIRLAYISPDLREHPVGHLMAGVFEHHDDRVSNSSPFRSESTTRAGCAAGCSRPSTDSSTPRP